MDISANNTDKEIASAISNEYNDGNILEPEPNVNVLENDDDFDNLTSSNSSKVVE